MSEECLKNAQDLTKSQKHELMTHSLSNMDPRDASASKKVKTIMLMQTQEIGRQNVENGTSYSRAGTARPNAQST